MSVEVLIATNGYKGTLPAIRYGSWLAATLQMHVTLLGIAEKVGPAQIDDHHPLEDIFSSAVETFQQEAVDYSLEVQNGNAEQIIARKAAQGEYLTVLGTLGRPQIRHMLSGRSIHQLIEQLKGPIVYVPQACMPVRSILICVGGLGYEVTAENLAIQLASRVKARVTLMHVIPPMDLNYPSAREIQRGGSHLGETDTLPGRALRAGLELAQKQGLEASLKIREGNIVEEILTEVRSGDYDLICMGSPFSTRSLRQMYSPNVAAEVAEEVSCPTLVARLEKDQPPSS
jgi:nucleotide-binding universal stress UspA family protein